jgi:hypothetical protein
MKRFWFASVLLTIISFTSARAANLLTCTNCSTQASFNSQALSAAPNRVGTFEYLVANPNTNVVYDIVVEVDGDVGAGGQHVRGIDSSTTSSDLNSAFAYWWPKFTTSAEGATLWVQAPGDYNGISSFNAWTQEGVCDQFVHASKFRDMVAHFAEGGPLEMLFDVLEQKLGHGPVGVFIFYNGDVAEYYVYPNQVGLSNICYYVPGSARNYLGEFINDSGNGGTGHTNGSDYVRGGSQQYTIFLEPPEYLSCAYLVHDDGSREFLGCDVQ